LSENPQNAGVIIAGQSRRFHRQAHYPQLPGLETVRSCYYGSLFAREKSVVSFTSSTRCTARYFLTKRGIDMIEIIAVSLLAAAIVYYGLPLFDRYNAAKLAKELEIPGDSVLRRHFLTHLRHENKLLAAELEKHLAKAG
jgi:hypothetical protein